MSWNLEQAANDLERYVLRGELPAVDACKVLIENARAGRTCMDVTAAWSDFGENVFNDDALDDFDKFEKVYQILQEIVEPIWFIIEIERTEQNEFGIYDHLSCGHVAMRQWPEKTRYCPHCGAKVVEE